MKGEIILQDKTYPYEIRKNKRARNITLRFSATQGVIVSQPYYLPYRAGKFFMDHNTAWLEKRLKHFEKHGVPRELKGKRSEYLQNKEMARRFIKTRLLYFNEFYKFKYRNISIRNNSSRWGSCSAKGNINFHYKLALIDQKLADYVIVHELCHLKQMNHSKKFWELIAQTIPDYKLRRKSLHNSGSID